MARAALFIATMVVVSALSRSAFAAAAPFCDDRGATALAAPPDLQAPDDAIQRARATACGLEANADSWMVMLRPARAQVGATSPQPSPARLASEPIVLGPAGASLLEAPETPGGPSLGERSRVERPPRT